MNRFAPREPTTQVYDDPEKFKRDFNKFQAEGNNPNSLSKRLHPYGRMKNFIYDPAASRKQLMNQ
jgi:hypothetical protein